MDTQTSNPTDEGIVTFATDTDGEAIALVQLSNHPRPAKLLREDWDALRSRDVSPYWQFNTGSASPLARGYVRATVNGTFQTIARLLVRAGVRQIVTYRDGDTLNCRRDNLVIRHGKASRVACLPAQSE